MKVLKADHNRLYEIPGNANPARRPVDIDAAKTGFTRLRSLRVYRFEAGSVIDGHTEEDEVFVVVMRGSVEIKIGFEDTSVDSLGVFTLTAPTDTTPFVAYLPPRAVYQLIPDIAADIAYARATPLQGNSPAVFRTNVSAPVDGVTTLFDERAHAERLQLRIIHVAAREKDVDVQVADWVGAECEALVHVQGSSNENLCTLLVEDGEEFPLVSWDTAILDGGDNSTLRVPQDSTVLVLTVLAA